MSEENRKDIRMLLKRFGVQRTRPSSGIWRFWEVVCPCGCVARWKT